MESSGKKSTAEMLKERITSSKSAGSTSTGSSISSTTLGRFFGRGDSSGGSGDSQSLSKNNAAAATNPVVQQLACSGANKNPAFGLHQSATRMKYSASDTFVASLLVLCQARLLDDDDDARKESALIMTDLFSFRRKYCKELLCVPLVLPHPLHDEDNFSLPLGGGGGDWSICRWPYLFFNC